MQVNLQMTNVIAVVSKLFEFKFFYAVQKKGNVLPVVPTIFTLEVDPCAQAGIWAKYLWHLSDVCSDALLLVPAPLCVQCGCYMKSSQCIKKEFRNEMKSIEGL